MHKVNAPGPSRHPGRSVRRSATVTALIVLPLWSAGLAGSQGPDTLRVEEAVAVALQENPRLQASRLMADAAAERVGPAGAWSDPMLSFGLMNRPLDGFGTDEPMTMNSIQLSQRIPWPGKLGFSRERADLLADAQALEVLEMERQLVARVKSVYFRLAFMDRSLTVMRETRNLLRDFLDVSSTRYAVGEGIQQDVLQAQVAVARMTEDITVVEQERVALAARLNALLGRPATVPVDAVVLPTPAAELPAVEALLAQAAERRPALAAARQRALAAEAGYRSARRQLYPDLTVSLGYGQRPQFTDMASIMVGVSVPIFAGSSKLPLRRELAAEQAAREAQEQDLYNETFAQITELRAEAERAIRLVRLYDEAILPQAEAAVESAFSAYRVGQVDYMTLVENEMTVNRYEIESLRLSAEFQRALAELEALVGGPIGGSQ
jgi:cobalt-zinc-cadmium efflux system outer membrane protein